MTYGNLSLVLNSRARPRLGERVADVEVPTVACPYCGGREIGQAPPSEFPSLGVRLQRVIQWDLGPADDDGTRLAVPVALERMARMSHPTQTPFGCMSCGHGLDHYDLAMQSR